MKASELYMINSQLGEKDGDSLQMPFAAPRWHRGEARRPTGAEKGR